MERKTIDEYTASEPTRVWFARLWLDDNDGAGRVVVMCDGRVWMYRWPAATRGTRGGKAFTLAHWLHDSSISYIADKMNADSWFDREGTVAAAREHVCAARRRRYYSLSRDEARELYNSAGEITDRSSAEAWIGGYLNANPDGWEDAIIQETIDPVFRKAFELLWPQLAPPKDPPPADPNYTPGF